MYHRRRRNGDLRRPGGDRLQELEIRRWMSTTCRSFPVTDEPRRREIHFAALASEFHLDAAADRHAFELLQEIDVEVGAAEFAVGHAPQADGLLLP